ncbi:MAG: hypothetical protein QUU85_20025, partial [Candidatus Eisenbacteria bacterium]|nr:hypothetical protein [Candidatus Eisenbacteria bacterium]
MKKFHFLLAAAVAVAVVLAAGAVSGQGTYNKSAFEKAMEGLNRDLRVTMGSIVASDWAKAEASARSIAAQAKMVRTLTPPTRTDQIADFQAHADSLGARAGRLAVAASAKNGESAG